LRLVERLIAALRDGTGEPALHTLLRQEHARIAREIDAGTTRERLHDALCTLKQSLYRYQQEGVDRFLVRGRLLLADDMGLGKTAQAIAACHALWHTGRVRRGLLVVPAALKPQ
jgi:SNF2 family DNA or RNA helicase